MRALSQSFSMDNPRNVAMRLYDLGFLIIAAGIAAAVALVVASQVG